MSCAVAVLMLFLKVCAWLPLVLGPNMLHVGGPNCVLVCKPLLLLLLGAASTMIESEGRICGRPDGLPLVASAVVVLVERVAFPDMLLTHSTYTVLQDPAVTVLNGYCSCVYVRCRWCFCSAFAWATPQNWERVFLAPCLHQLRAFAAALVQLQH
jgi:hypothetical protein